MRQTIPRRRRWPVYWLVLGLVLTGIIVGTSLAQAIGGENTGNTPAWAAPNAMALRKVSALGNTQDEPNLLGNLDCDQMTYRLAASSTMQTGCFTPTAFGLLDSDNDMVIFNGTDEGLPLSAYSPHQLLAPWPKALDLVALDAVNTGGSYISLYKNPLSSLRDQRNLLGQLTAKQLITPPELGLQDPAGQRLVVNPATLAFSDSGSWLVAETLGGSFVRINLATLAMTPFAPAFGSPGSPALLKSQVAISDDGQYVAIENGAAASFKVYDLTTCNGGNPSSLEPQRCQSYDYQPFIQRQVAGLQSVRHVRFVNDGLVSFEATAANSGDSGLYELAPADSITSLIGYLGVGDSYTSGEGAFDYLAGTDTGDNMCHLSVDSYPLLLARDLFGGAGGHSVACSGAEINDVGSTNEDYRGQVKNVPSLEQLKQTDPGLLESVETNFLPGYVAQQAFVKQYQPQVTTVSIGGNDVGFGDILLKCVEARLSRHASDETCYNTYEDRSEVVALVNRTVPRCTALYKQLLAEAPGIRLYAIGYPQVFDDTGNCALNVHLDKSELEFAEELTDYLNGAIQQAATNAGVPYVDISQALDGHRLCQAASYDVAVNGLTAGTDKVVFGKESYHPNTFGQELIEQAILKQTHNFQLGTSSGASPNNSDNLLQVPKSGRPINTLISGNGLVNSVIGAGGSSQLSISGLTNGLAPGGSYTVRLDGAGGTVIGTLISGNNGDILGSVTIPDTTSPGGHTIDVTGSNQAGDPVDITQPIYVPVSNSDADGDGIPDSLDSCPGVVNSGQGVDQDGVDDACDSLISLSPTGGGAGEDSQTTNGAGNSTPNPGAEPVGAGQASSSPVTAPTDSGDSEPLGTLDASSSSSPTATSTLPANSDSVIATFSAVGNHSSGSKVSLGRVNKFSATAVILGGRTNRVAAVPPRTILPPQVSTGNTAVHRAVPGVIRWLPWASLFILLPCLLLVFSGLGKQPEARIGARAYSQGRLSKVFTRTDTLLYNRLMVWLRKGIVHLLSLVLLVSLLGAAFATSATVSLTHPAKIESWLAQGNFYSNAVTNVLHNAQQSASNDAGAGRVLLTDAPVEQAVRSVFSPQLLKQYSSTILNSNYAWLQGKTSSPNFKIDLTSAKQKLAQQVGQRVETRLASLPACSTAQLAQLQATLTTDPLTIPCQLPGITPQAASKQVTEQINESSDFLSNPVITASALNPNGGNQGTPYYQRLSSAPKLYKWGQRLPWIFSILILLSLLGIVFIAPRKRRGVRRIGIVMLLAGIILLVVKFLADTAFNRFEKHLFNNSSIGQLQQSLTDVLHRAEVQLVKIDLWFAIAFLVIAVLLFILLWFTRRKKDRIKPADIDSFGRREDNPVAPQQPGATPALPTLKPRQNPQPPRLVQ